MSQRRAPGATADPRPPVIRALQSLGTLPVGIGGSAPHISEEQLSRRRDHR
jgi:hypothetical protein